MTFVIDLPMPPSLNSIWRAKRGKAGKPGFYLDARYKRWKLAADGEYWICGKRASFVGPVKVEIALNQAQARATSDCDNRIKPIQDWLQRAGILANDLQVKDVRAFWGEAPKGCRVSVEDLT